VKLCGLGWHRFRPSFNGRPMKTPFSKSVMKSPYCFWSSNRTSSMQRFCLMDSCVLNCWCIRHKADTDGRLQPMHLQLGFRLGFVRHPLLGRAILYSRTLQGHYRSKTNGETSIHTCKENTVSIRNAVRIVQNPRN